MLLNYYSAIGLLAICIYLIINYSYFKHEDIREEYKEYKTFLRVVLLYFVNDVLWGIFSEMNNITLLYGATVLYFITMAFTVVCCCRYITSFLKLNNRTGKIINTFGLAFAFMEIVVLIINHFHHIFFWFDETGAYQAFMFRDIAHAIQVLMYGTISAMSLVKALRSINVVRRRNMNIFLCALCMTSAIILQTIFPFVPLYTIGLLLGILIVKVFIYNEEQMAQMKRIEQLNIELRNEQSELHRQKDEIASAFGIIDVLSHDFHTIWLANKDDMKIRLVRDINKTASAGAVQMGLQNADYSQVMKMYIHKYVAEEDRQRLLELGSPEVVLQKLSESDYYALNFTRLKEDGSTDYCQVAFANVNTDGGRNRFSLGFRNIDEMLKQKLELERNIAANEAKTKFLHNMSHEIRTPLNAMFGFSQLLGMPDGSWTDEEKTQYNQYIYNSYVMLEMLINDILDIADSEHGNYRIELSAVNVNEAARAALMLVEFRVPDGVQLNFTTDFSDEYVIRSDKRRIQQLLINYLTNACKNTEKGEIHLHCSKTEHPGKITFSVKDTGRGVPKDKADLIFNRFTKLNSNIQGSGLGLNICQTIAEKLDGEVYLDKTYTNGARFVFVVEDKQ